MEYINNIFTYLPSLNLAEYIENGLDWIIR